MTTLPPIAYKRPWLTKLFLFLLSNAAARLFIILLAASALALAGAWISNWYVGKVLARQQSGATQQERIITREQKNILERLAQHIILPAGENPAIAAIANSEMLANNNSFYSNTQDGDQLIIYANAALAIIYSPARDKIINIGPLTNARIMNKTLSVEIRNGTNKIGLAGKLSEQLKVDSDFEVLDIGYAEKRNYTKNILIDLTGGSKPDLIKKLEDKLGLTAVASLPVGEKDSKAEAFIILGK